MVMLTNKHYFNCLPFHRGNVGQERAKAGNSFKHQDTKGPVVYGTRVALTREQLGGLRQDRTSSIAIVYTIKLCIIICKLTAVFLNL